METPLKLKLLFEDKVGVLAGLALVMADEGFNIVAMEIEREGGTADIYVEAEMIKGTAGPEKLMARIANLPHILGIASIKTLPKERREKRFQALLDSVSDGILFIDEEANLAIINKIAEKALGIADNNMLGRKITELDLPDKSILESLEGATCFNVKKDIITPHGHLQFFITCKPIINTSGRVIGAVEILKDVKEIRELADIVINSPMNTFSDIVGESLRIKKTIAYAQMVAQTDSIISLQGESGTGKEVFAKAIHHASGRTGPFIPINCAAIPEQLLESELFGYAKGAFTGASKEGRPGLFEASKNGTIFLDEITELPLGLQSKLLRALQEKVVRRIGENREIPFHSRIITATNRKMEDLVTANKFREDLYYRINVLPIVIPPLRERKDDLKLLAEGFIRQLNLRHCKKVEGLSGDALQKLVSHSWPGNVRELRNVIERAVILCPGGRVHAEHVLINTEIEMRPDSHGLPRSPVSGALHALLDQFEKDIIEDRLKKHKSIRKAAGTLMISHTSLLRKIKKHRNQ